MLNKIFLAAIKIYQKTASPDHGVLSFWLNGKVCRFYPTCSEYARLSIEKYGIIKGLILSLKRISRCHPFDKGGYDPVK